MGIVILAIDMGERMRSALPKVLHPLTGKPLPVHVIETVCTIPPAHLAVVVGHGGDRVREMVGVPDIAFAMQDKQLDTGHAAMQAVDQLDESVPTLVLHGNVSLTCAEALNTLIGAIGNDHLGVLTVYLGDPIDYGHIARDAAGRITHIIEQKDANETQPAIHGVNTGILVCPTVKFRSWLATLSNDNMQGRYYLTDVVGRTASKGVPITPTHPLVEWETLSVNSRMQLAKLERIHRRNLA